MIRQHLLCEIGGKDRLLSPHGHLAKGAARGISVTHAGGTPEKDEAHEDSRTPFSALLRNRERTTIRGRNYRTLTCRRKGIMAVDCTRPSAGKFARIVLAT
jgi:hypothetical protein